MKRLFVTFFVALAVLLVGALGVFAQDAMAPPTVMLGGNDELGPFLVDSEGMTLYLYAMDQPGVTNCYDRCAVAWPPLLEGDTRPTLEEGVPGRLGVIPRNDGGRQITYNGWPLYYWQDDMAPGDATGEGVNGVWYVLSPPTVGLGGNDELGQFLVGPDGMTLYGFANDEPGVSNCYDQCAVNWPPLLVDLADQLSTLPGLVGEFDTTTRTDGTLQVTYDGWPLYYWVNDEAIGDSTGHGVNDVWFVLKPPTVNLGGDDNLGDFLIGPDGMTLYLFTNDAADVSNCYDQCAANWPPLLVAEGETPTAGEGVPGELGVITREDGGLQVTYDGVPLYYWFNDVVPGDATGQDVGGVWYVVSPGGGM